MLFPIEIILTIRLSLYKNRFCPVRGDLKIDLSFHAKLFLDCREIFRATTKKAAAAFQFFRAARVALK
jgi:hypothetical protein